ncbi:unnamed protein product [Malus baccata var. baccata]
MRATANSGGTYSSLQHKKQPNSKTYEESDCVLIRIRSRVLQNKVIHDTVVLSDTTPLRDAESKTEFMRNSIPHLYFGPRKS